MPGVGVLGKDTEAGDVLRRLERSPLIGRVSCRASPQRLRQRLGRVGVADEVFEAGTDSEERRALAMSALQVRPREPTIRASAFSELRGHRQVGGDEDDSVSMLRGERDGLCAVAQQDRVARALENAANDLSNRFLVVDEHGPGPGVHRRMSLVEHHVLQFHVEGARRTSRRARRRTGSAPPGAAGATSLRSSSRAHGPARIE